MKQLQAELDQDVDLSVAQPTIAEWCRTWLTTFATNLKSNIRDDYHGILRRYIDGSSLGKRRLDKLTAAEVQAWANELNTRVKPKTVRNVHARLHKALEVAVRNGYIARNVASKTELPQIPSHQIHPLDVHQVKALLKAVEHHRLYALYRLAVNLGMREGELFGLTWSAINFERGTLLIHQQRQRARKDGKQNGPKAFILQPTKTKAGEWTLKLDDLRHTAATLMLADGVPLVTVSKILGHSSPAVTANIYAHVLDEAKSQAIASLSKQLKKDE